MRTGIVYRFVAYAIDFITDNGMHLHGIESAGQARRRAQRIQRRSSPSTEKVTAVELGMSRDELLDKVWGYKNYPCTRTVDNHILRLPQKLENDPANPRHLLTMHGLGYRFMP